MIYLGKHVAGTSVWYGAHFHTDQGTVEDPTTPTVRLRTPAGAWSDLTTPAKQDTKTGFFGGTIDTTGFAAGQYIIALRGTVSTAKSVATEFCFMIGAAPAVPGDAMTLTSAYDAAKTAATATNLATVDTVVDAIKLKTDLIPASPAAVGSAMTLTADYDPAKTAASATNLATVDTVVDAIAAKTVNLPASPAAVSDIPTANANADALLDRADAIETAWTPRKVLRVIAAALCGKLSGAATTTIKARSIIDAKDRITATVDADGNRTSLTLDGA